MHHDLGTTAAKLKDLALGHAEVQQEATGTEEKCEKGNLQVTSQSRNTSTVPSQGNASMPQVSGTYISTFALQINPASPQGSDKKGTEKTLDSPLQVKALGSNQVRFKTQPYWRRSKINVTNSQ